MEKFDKKKVYFLLFVLLLVLAFLAVITIVLVILIFFSDEEKHSDKTEYFDYSEITPDLNMTTYGYVKLNREFVGEYMSYVKMENGNTAVISKSSNNRFRCTGSCYCLDEEEEEEYTERRFAQTILARGLTLILSAVSVSVAMNIAQEAFEKNCENKFKDTCEFRNVDIDSCDDSLDEDIDYSEILEGFEGEAEEADPDTYQRFCYSCRGHCVPNYFGDDFELEERNKKFGEEGCRELSVVGEVELDINHNPVEIRPAEMRAKQRFVIQYLAPFCDTQSNNFCVAEDLEGTGDPRDWLNNVYCALVFKKEIESISM